MYSKNKLLLNNKLSSYKTFDNNNDDTKNKILLLKAKGSMELVKLKPKIIKLGIASLEHEYILPL